MGGDRIAKQFVCDATQLLGQLAQASRGGRHEALR
jgi:hypothetical protein